MSQSEGNLIQAIANLIIRPVRDIYHLDKLGPPQIVIKSKHTVPHLPSYMTVNRVDGVLSGISYSVYRPECPQPNRKCVVFLHGNNGSRLEAIQNVKYVLQYGWLAVSLDLRGSGVSEGANTTMGVKESLDLQQMLLYLHQRHQIVTFGLWGRSMGASTALFYLAKHYPADRVRTGIRITSLVADSPFSNLQTLMLEIATKKLNLPEFIFSPLITAIREKIKATLNLDLLEEADLLRELRESKLQHILAQFHPFEQISCLFLTAFEDRVVSHTQVEALHHLYPFKNKKIQYIGCEHNIRRSEAVKNQCGEFLCGSIPPLPPRLWDLSAPQQALLPLFGSKTTRKTSLTQQDSPQVYQAHHFQKQDLSQASQNSLFQKQHIFQTSQSPLPLTQDSPQVSQIFQGQHNQTFSLQSCNTLQGQTLDHAASRQRPFCNPQICFKMRQEAHLKTKEEQTSFPAKLHSANPQMNFRKFPPPSGMKNTLTTPFHFQTVHSGERIMPALITLPRPVRRMKGAANHQHTVNTRNPFSQSGDSADNLEVNRQMDRHINPSEVGSQNSHVMSSTYVFKRVAQRHSFHYAGDTSLNVSGDDNTNLKHQDRQKISNEGTELGKASMNPPKLSLKQRKTQMGKEGSFKLPNSGCSEPLLLKREGTKVYPRRSQMREQMWRSQQVKQI